MKKIALALCNVHNAGFLHNDLKANNVVLDKERGEDKFNPVVIDFGKSLPMTSLKGPKKLSHQEQVKYTDKYPHIAPEIVEGSMGQSVKSDIFSFGKLCESVFAIAKLGHLPEVLARALSLDPDKRPTLEAVIESLQNVQRSSNAN